jgi:tetratricopeptide (TPR) repeat protein
MRRSTLRDSTQLIRTLCRCGGQVALAVAFAAQVVAQESDAPQREPVLPHSQVESSSNGTNVPPLPSSSEVVNDAWQFFTNPNNPAPRTAAPPKPVEDFKARLELARNCRLTRQFVEATALYAGILQSAAPESLQRTALIELALTAQDQNDLVRAQQIYAQGLARWPQDAGVPEFILRQGLVYRQMGLNGLAISKFYTVMTSALSLKTDRFDYYQQLVLRAQNEIAGAQYDLGRWAEAADSLGRLLKLDPPPDNRSAIQCKLIRCLVTLGRHADAFAQAQDFLNRHPDAPERPEVRFLCATSLKQIGRGADALSQVLALLQEQQGAGTREPATLAYWQRRAGNEIANRFYQEGEQLRALDIYLSLASLSSSPEWQLPVWYQIGLVFERLNQPAKAFEYYGNIARREKELAITAAPSLKTLIEMARWRKDFIAWRLKSETANLEFRAMLGDKSIAPTSNATAPPIQSKGPAL